MRHPLLIAVGASEQLRQYQRLVGSALALD
jgi:hypothetical protein